MYTPEVKAYAKKHNLTGFTILDQEVMYKYKLTTTAELVEYYENKSKFEAEYKAKESEERKKKEEEEVLMCAAGNGISGYKITQHKGMVCGVVTYQAPMEGIFAITPASNEKYTEKVNEAISKARSIAYAQAKEMGANAIINVDLDFNEFEFHTKMIMEFIYLYVTVHFNGDAVVVEKCEEN